MSPTPYQSAPPKLPARDPAGHKGTFGTVAVVGGSCAGAALMAGAPTLAARAALRAGCGLCKLVVPAPIAVACVQMAPSCTALTIPVEADGVISPGEASRAARRALDESDVVVVGPGMGLGLGPGSLLGVLIAQAETPLVIDADALTALAKRSDLTSAFVARAVLTPHPGEFARLAATLGIKPSPTDPAQRPAAAAELARMLDAVVVLKGAGTIVSDGVVTWQNTTGSHALATAGTGDVLAGLVGGLIAQTHGRASLFDLACIAVAAHGAAADAWTASGPRQAGLLAEDLVDLLPAAIERYRG